LPLNTILLSQDESRFSSETNRVTSWSQSGTSVVYSGYRYGTSLNCFGSINLQNGHLISSFHDRGNSEATIEHFKKVRKKYKPDIPLAIFIDNASWHKTLTVKEYCDKNNITLLFLPPYSPEFNPIERVWSFLKGKIKQRFFLTSKQFKTFVFDLFENINITDQGKLASQCCSLINY
jgi:transposase